MNSPSNVVLKLESQEVKGAGSQQTIDVLKQATVVDILIHGKLEKRRWCTLSHAIRQTKHRSGWRTYFQYCAYARM